ncbi:MAG: hypothetical protein NW208_01820 [Bryobacter sp.]|nr:hypothetical protein [Bryobacter sp.]
MRVRLILCALPFEESMLARGQSDAATQLPIISAEDLLLLTLFRFRPEALDQAKALLLAQRGRLQWPYIDHWLPQLAELKEDPRPLDALNALREALAKM